MTDQIEVARADGANGGDAAGAAAQRQFVTFVAGGQLFAVDMAPVLEIIRVPALVRVPLSPPTLEGLANLRGRVLPIVSLRRVLGFPDLADDEQARAVVLDYGQPIGFVVDRVASVIGIDPASIEGVEQLGATVNTDLLSGMIKADGAQPMVMVLDFEKLIAREFAALAVGSTRRALAAGPAASGAGTAAALEPILHLVSFAVAGQEYAISIDHVREIVQVPAQLTQLPHTAPHVLGVITLRQQLLPLVGLRTMFGLPPAEAAIAGRIVVVGLDGITVGIVVDSVNEVLRVPLAQVAAMPALLARDEALRDISEICQLDGGQRLVSVISAAKLFRHGDVRQALAGLEQAEAEAEGQPHGSAAEAGIQVGATPPPVADEEQLVVFRLRQQEFGVPIASVQEIVRVPERLTQVPRAPQAVEGVINLRGAVLPVFDLRRRLGLEAAERNEGQRIVVLLLDGVRSGFMVDAVAEVLKVPAAAIEAAPRLSGQQAGLLARMANLPQQRRLLQLIDPAHLLDADELAGAAGLVEAGEASALGAAA